MAIPAPHRYIRPSVMLGTVDSTCHFAQFTVNADQEFVDVETYCNPGGEAPGKVTWTAVGSARMSYGTESFWEQFSALAGTVATFTVRPDEDVIGTSNPEATFSAYVPQIPFIPPHDVGGSALFDVEFKIIGEPTFATA